MYNIFLKNCWFQEYGKEGQHNLDHYGELVRKYQKNYEDMSKGHRIQFEAAPTIQIWWNLDIKMNNNSNVTYGL